MTPERPDIQAVDFDNIDQITRFATQLFAYANHGQMLTSSKNRQSEDGVYIIETAKKWINSVMAKMTLFNHAEKLKLRPTIEMVHIVAYRQRIDQSYFDNMLLDIFEAHIHGDTTIDVYDLFDAIDQELNRGNKRFFGKPLQWHSYTLETWWETYRYGAGTKKQSDYDTLRQVAALINQDLSVFESNQTAFKKKLVEAHRHYLSKTADLTPAATNL